MKINRGTLTILEGLVLLVSFVVIVKVSSNAHRWMWAQAELLTYRSTMRELTTTIHTLRVRAMTQHRPFELRIEPQEGRFQVVAIHQTPSGPIERVERTFWLPQGLKIIEAPSVLRVSPSGEFLSTGVMMESIAHSRCFRLTTAYSGVQWHEELTL